MSYGIRGFDGTVALPAWTFANDTDTGFYRIGADNLGLSIGGTKRWDIDADGFELTGTFSASGAVTLSSTLAVTGAATFSSTINGQTISSTASLTGSLSVGTTLAVTGAATFSSTINGQTISSAASLTGTLAVAGAVTLSSTLAVTGTTTMVNAVVSQTLNIEHNLRQYESLDYGASYTRERDFGASNGDAVDTGEPYRYRELLTGTASSGGFAWVLRQLLRGGTTRDVISVSALGTVTVGSLVADSLTSSGSATVASVSASGTVVAATFSGSGALLTGVPATSLTGTVASARLSGSYTGVTGVGTLSSLTVSGTVTGGTFSGSGASLTSLPAAQLTGTVASGRLSGSYTGVTGLGTLTSLTVSGAITGGSLNLGGATLTDVLSATTTWDPANLSPSTSGAAATTTVAVTGAAVGDPVVVSNPYQIDSAFLELTGYVSAANTVTLRLRNFNTSDVNATSRSVRVVVLKF